MTATPTIATDGQHVEHRIVGVADRAPQLLADGDGARGVDGERHGVGRRRDSGWGGDRGHEGPDDEQQMFQEAGRAFAKQGLAVQLGVKIADVNVTKDDVTVKYADATGAAQSAPCKLQAILPPNHFGSCASSTASASIAHFSAVHGIGASHGRRPGPGRVRRRRRVPRHEPGQLALEGHRVGQGQGRQPVDGHHMLDGVAHPPAVERRHGVRIGVQASIDSTGKAQDVLRRIQVRLPLVRSLTSPAPRPGRGRGR